MAIIVSKTVPAGETSDPIPLNVQAIDFKVGMIFTAADGDTTVRVQVTMQDFNRIDGSTPNPPTRWHTIELEDGVLDYPVSQTDGADGNIFFPVSGVRFENTGTETVIVDLIQGSSR